MPNKLYFGDNLDILKNKIQDDSIDLIYLDPPFQSGKSYNQIFQPENNGIKGATAQIKAFEDTWRWGIEAENNYQGLITGQINKEKPNQKLIELMKSLRNYLGECSMMAYLSIMAPKLLEMKRVLKETGSIYLHCDPTASHYLKLLMDAIFGVNNFRNEIVWQRKTSSATKKSIAHSHDIIFRYSKSETVIFNPQFTDYSEEYIKSQYTHKDKKGIYRIHDVVANPSLGGSSPRYEYKGYVPKTRWLISKEELQRLDKEKKLLWSKSGKPYRKLYLKDMKGEPISDIWTDIPISLGDERIGYPTQKPEKLLERIITMSSNEKDLILDPFCGCGTTVAVAQKLGRKWIGIDITYLAIDVISKRLKKSEIKEGIDFEIEGEPKDVYSAEKLAEQDPFQFQIWCISKLNAVPSPTKTGDKGVDGVINFIDNTKKDKVGKGIIQVRGTKNVFPEMVRELKGTMKSQNADFGILITFKQPTQGMISEAVKEGNYQFGVVAIPKIQLLTVEDLFKNNLPVNLHVFSPFNKPKISKNNNHENKQIYEY